MKKIVLGCAAVLLSLGLLAGCNNDTDSAVTISVDNTATVVVGETLALPYTVEPEKAKVEVLNDHEEYVTASAKDGVLSLEGLAAGSATITLVGTYKKYEEANVDIKVSVVTEKDVGTEPGIEGPNTYKLGALDSANYVYKYFNGQATTTSGTGGATNYFLGTSEGWDNGVDVSVTAIEDDEVDNSFTMSFIDSDGELKYIQWSTSTQIVISDTPYTWVWDSTNELIVTNEDSVRFLALYSSASIRAYTETEQYLAYDHVTLFETEPAEPEKPETPELEQVTSLTDGQSYYFGAESNGVYHLITGSISSYNLAVTDDFGSAVQVKATQSDGKWKLTIGEQYIYVMLYTPASGSSKLEIGLDSAETVPSSGVNLFDWSSTNKTVYQTSVYSNSSYTCVYFEYYSGVIQPYGMDAETSTFTNAAHLYQVVEQEPGA